MVVIHIKLLLLMALFLGLRLLFQFAPLLDPKTRYRLCDLSNAGVIASLVSFGLSAWVFQLSRVDGDSMLPSLRDGEFTVVNKLIYRLHRPERGDIIVFRSPNEEGVDYIKRVIALPGETVAIENGWVIVKGLRLNEPYVMNTPDVPYSQVTVRPEHLFVLGDNRLNSSDSRTFDDIPLDDVLGKASFILWPSHRWGFIQSFRGRRFRGLSVE